MTSTDAFINLMLVLALPLFVVGLYIAYFIFLKDKWEGRDERKK